MDQTPVQPHGIGERLHARANARRAPGGPWPSPCVVLEEASARGGTIDTAKIPADIGLYLPSYRHRFLEIRHGRETAGAGLQRAGCANATNMRCSGTICWRSDGFPTHVTLTMHCHTGENWTCHARLHLVALSATGAVPGANAQQKADASPVATIVKSVVQFAKKAEEARF